MNKQGKEATFSAFKQAQIRHRRQGNSPCRTDDLPEVVDFGIGTDDRIIQLKIPDHALDERGLYQGPIYGLKGFPGFLFATQALSEDLQIRLAFKCVTKFCESPHRTNIDLCPPKEAELLNLDESMWELWKKTKDSEKSNDSLKKGTKKRKLQQTSQKSYRSFKKLSWATMGYHYDWTERSYNEESKSVIPDIISNLSKLFSKTSLALDNVDKSELSLEALHFVPEASIINYYNTKSQMGGHRDDLEMALDKPVVSLSMGLPAVFLLGGKTKEECVVPILLRPGDVMCLGGDARLKFHSMARVLPHTVPLPGVKPSLCANENQRLAVESIKNDEGETEDLLNISDVDLQGLKEYLREHRININVRQVYR